MRYGRMDIRIYCSKKASAYHFLCELARHKRMSTFLLHRPHVCTSTFSYNGCPRELIARRKHRSCHCARILRFTLSSPKAGQLPDLEWHIWHDQDTLYRQEDPRHRISCSSNSLRSDCKDSSDRHAKPNENLSNH